MTGTTEGFKRAFQKKLGKAKDNFDIRANKVQAAVDDLDKWTQHLEARNSPDAATSRGKVNDFREKLRYARTMVASGDKKQAQNAFDALDDVKKDARDALKQGRIAAKKTPFSVDPGNGQPTNVFMSDIPGFHELGNTPDPRFGNDTEQVFMQKQVAAKMQAGRAAFDNLQALSDNDFDNLPPPDAKAVTDLAWFLKSKSQEKVGEPWERGALTVPDPKGRLARYLKRSTEGYTRGSSHLKDQQAAPRGQGWGIDFYEGVEDGKPAANGADRLLPSGMRTILIQEVATDTEKRLYIKMETESARLDPMAPLRARKDKKRGVVRDNPDSRALVMADLPRSIEHGKNLIKSIMGMSQGDDKELAGFREKIDSEMKERYKDLCKQAAKLSPNIGKILGSGQGHVFQMFEAMQQSLNRPELLTDELIDLIADCAEEMKATLREHSYDTDLGSRFGNEIALMPSDVAPQPVPQPAPQQPPPQNGAPQNGWVAPNAGGGNRGGVQMGGNRGAPNGGAPNGGAQPPNAPPPNAQPQAQPVPGAPGGGGRARSGGVMGGRSASSPNLRQNPT